MFVYFVLNLTFVCSLLLSYCKWKNAQIKSNQIKNQISLCPTKTIWTHRCYTSKTNTCPPCSSLSVVSCHMLSHISPESEKIFSSLWSTPLAILPSLFSCDTVRSQVFHPSSGIDFWNINSPLCTTAFLTLKLCSLVREETAHALQNQVPIGWKARKLLHPLFNYGSFGQGLNWRIWN